MDDTLVASRNELCRQLMQLDSRVASQQEKIEELQRQRAIDEESQLELRDLVLDAEESQLELRDLVLNAEGRLQIPDWERQSSALTSEVREMLLASERSTEQQLERLSKLIHEERGVRDELAMVKSGKLARDIRKLEAYVGDLPTAQFVLECVGEASAGHKAELKALDERLREISESPLATAVDGADVQKLLGLADQCTDLVKICKHVEDAVALLDGGLNDHEKVVQDVKHIQEYVADLPTALFVLECIDETSAEHKAELEALDKRLRETSALATSKVEEQEDKFNRLMSRVEEKVGELDRAAASHWEELANFKGRLGAHAREEPTDEEVECKKKQGKNDKEFVAFVSYVEKCMVDVCTKIADMMDALERKPDQDQVPTMEQFRTLTQVVAAFALTEEDAERMALLDEIPVLEDAKDAAERRGPGRGPPAEAGAAERRLPGRGPPAKAGAEGAAEHSGPG